MPKYRKKIWSGDVYEVEEYFCPRKIGKEYERGIPQNLTSEEQEKRNLQRARKKLSRLINCNFNSKDYFVTLTFREDVEEEEGRKLFRNFCKRVQRYRKKMGLSAFKYIVVTEKKPCLHIHVVMNGIDNMTRSKFEQWLFDIWKNGFVYAKKLYKNQKDNRLANYITKENLEKNERRWTPSKNLDKPKIVVEEVATSKKRRKLSVPKGYEEVFCKEEFYEEIGWLRYMKAIRLDGTDYGEDLENEDFKKRE